MTRRRFVVALAALAVAGGGFLYVRSRGSGPRARGHGSGVVARWAGPLEQGERTVLLSAADAEECGADCPFRRVVAGSEGRAALADVIAFVGDGIENLSTLEESSADAKRTLSRAHRALEVRARQDDGAIPVRAVVVGRRGAAARSAGSGDYRAVLLFDHADARLDGRRTGPSRATGWRLLVARHAGGGAAVAGCVEATDPFAAEPTPPLPEPEADLVARLRGPAPGLVPSRSAPGSRPSGLALAPDGRVTSYGAAQGARDPRSPALVASLRRLLEDL